jgi:hypothetical protein
MYQLFEIISRKNKDFLSELICVDSKCFFKINPDNVFISKMQDKSEYRPKFQDSNIEQTVRVHLHAQFVKRLASPKWAS